MHVHRREYEAMRKLRRPMELAYDSKDFAHEPRWVLHSDEKCTQWMDLDAICLPFTAEVYLSSNSQL